MKSKLDLAHEMALELIKVQPSLMAYQIAERSFEYADAMYAEHEKREKQEAEEKHKQMRELLNADNTFIEKEGQHFDDAEWQPDWSVAPEWAVAWSYDRMGSHWWDSAPKKGFDMWIPGNSNGYKYDESPDFNYSGHWRDSLRKRPK